MGLISENAVSDIVVMGNLNIIEKNDIVTLFGPYVNIKHLFNNEEN